MGGRTPHACVAGGIAESSPGPQQQASPLGPCSWGSRPHGPRTWQACRQGRQAGWRLGKKTHQPDHEEASAHQAHGLRHGLIPVGRETRQSHKANSDGAPAGCHALDWSKCVWLPARGLLQPLAAGAMQPSCVHLAPYKADALQAAGGRRRPPTGCGSRCRCFPSRGTCCTPWPGPAQHGTAWHSMAQHGTAWHSMHVPMGNGKMQGRWTGAGAEACLVLAAQQRRRGAAHSTFPPSANLPGCLPACSPARTHLRIRQRCPADELPHLGGHQLARLLGGMVHRQLSIRQQRRRRRVYLLFRLDELEDRVVPHGAPPRKLLLQLGVIDVRGGLLHQAHDCRPGRAGGQGRAWRQAGMQTCSDRQAGRHVAAPGMYAVQQQGCSWQVPPSAVAPLLTCSPALPTPVKATRAIHLRSTPPTSTLW